MVAESEANKMILDIGCGENKHAGAIGVDIHSVEGVDVVADIRYLPFKDGAFSTVIAFDVFEHFIRGEILQVLAEWHRVLESGGTIIVKTPNLRTLAEAYLHGELSVQDYARKIYGGGTLSGNQYDLHYWGNDPSSIVDLFESAGFRNISVKHKGDGGDYFNMVLTAYRKKT